MQNDNSFDYENQSQSDADLYSRGKVLQREFDRLDQKDWNETSEFFIRLSDYDKQALKHYDEVCRSSATSKRADVEQNQGSARVDVGFRLSELFEKYIDEIRHGWRHKSAEKTEASVRDYLKLLIEVLGDIYSAKLDRSDVARFKDMLLKLPANRNKRREYKHKMVEELCSMKIPERHRLSSTTQREYLSAIARFLEWASANNYVKQDLGAALKLARRNLKTSKSANKQRDVFSDDDLSSLFNNERFVHGTHKLNAHHWVLLLGLFTGARQAELCQLHVSDVNHDQENGIWYLDINDKEDKVLKTDNAARVIPLHKQLIRLGFIDFVQSKSGKLLFDELSRNKIGSFAGFSKWFNDTYRKSCGVGQLVSETKDFHSFRHTFINTFKQRNIGEFHVVEEIAGHSANGSESVVRYSKGFGLKERNRVLQKLKYDSIDFGNIRTWKQVVALRKGRQKG